MNVAPWHALDSWRRMAGRRMEAAGLAPVESPSECVHRAPGLELLRYLGAAPGGPVLLIVPAPIKRHYIWDLQPSCSVVRRALEQGFTVYLARWTDTDDDHGIERCIELLAGGTALIREATGVAPQLAGHSLGGTLCAILAARHGAQLSSLTLIEAPLHFGADAGAFAPLVGSTPAGAPLATQQTPVAGSVLNLAAAMASPREFIWDRHLDGWAAAAQGRDAMQTYLLATRWSLDEFALPARLFNEVVDLLYRQDRFMRGELQVQGRRVGPADLQVPLAVVVDPRSETIPARSIDPFLASAASDDLLRLEYHGDSGVLLQHIGALIGQNAHRLLWPRLLAWMTAHHPGAAADVRPSAR
ncbi:alpha/beta hydrolase [Caldimonas brevitalea]|uniref:Polyhydroxyalkanoate synthase n=1 Tax=Caldimonas brevitalea TaxID=413882 RepID=A0A0G3BLP4_9BURK|nr:alpha/beta hydrolase [Caldimonas brevitalea]AKJ27480.1 polyhydroxyalkanoate synthase [Caldimonas brevitalea]